MYRDVPHPKHPGRLAFRFDPERDIIEIQDRGEKFTIDLAAYRKAVAKLVGVQLVLSEGVPDGELWLIRREQIGG